MHWKTLLSAIVLAGGASRRMGRDKALIPIAGVPLLQRTCDVALNCASVVYVITPQLETYRSIVPIGCDLVQESRSPQNDSPPGPLVGFAQGLRSVQTPWVLLLACDLPRLEATILQRWLEQLRTVNDEIALLPKGKKGWEPLCGFYRTTCLPSLELFIQAGGRSFQGWLAHESVRAIAFHSDPAENQHEHAMLFNCNTLEDLQNL
jgi:molybdenum cofactor guanylyltransferase